MGKTIEINPFVHKNEHLESMDQEPYPNPKNLARFGNPREEKGEERIWRRIWAWGRATRSLETRGMTAAAIFAGLGHGKARAKSAEEEENSRTKPLGAGFKRPPQGHRTLLMWHQTHAQRGLQFGIAPDDGHRTLALASGASSHAR